MANLDTGERKQNRILPIALGLLILVALSGVGYWFVAEGPGQQLLSPADSTVAEFAGDGDQTTEGFEVREGWAIQWESTGDAFAFAISGDREFGTVIDIDEPGNGVTSPTGSGLYRLEITADGPWTVSITQGE